MSYFLKQSTAVVVSFGPFLLNSDGVTLVINLVGTGANQTENTSTGIRIAKNGGAFAARHATATASTYDAFGNYLVTLDTTDTGTLGALRMQFANASAFCPVWMDFQIVTANIWDSLFGSDVLDTSVVQWLGTAVSTPTVAGVPNVNAKTWNDLATGALPLIPTTAGRTLDVSATGEAGVDWANVGSPTTSLALTGTTIATATNLTNAPTSGDFTATMKTSLSTAAGSANPSVLSAGYVGDIATQAQTLRFCFNTQLNGAPLTLAGSPSLAVYSGTNTSENTAGLTLTVNFDSKTGLHLVEIDMSADTTFYALAKNFYVVLAAGTVNSVSVAGTVVGEFSLANRPALISNGTSSGQIKQSGGYVSPNWGDVGGTSAVVNLINTTIANLTNAPDSGDLTSTMKASVATATTLGTPSLSVAGNNAVADAVMARTLGTESYAADGDVPTLGQAILALLSITGQFSIAGTSITCYELDGITPAFTFTLTLNSAGAPTARVRAT